MPLADVRSLFLELSGRHDLQSEGTVTGVYTNSGLTAAYVSGGILGSVLYIKMAAATAALFRKTQTVILRLSYDYDLDVLATVTNVTPNGASSYLTVTLQEADDNSSVNTLASCDTIANTKIMNIDWYINKGQKLLDRMLVDSKTLARYPVNISLNQIFIPLFQCRAVKSVWMGSATERWELEKNDIDDLKDYYNEPVANITSEQPAYYAPVVVRPYPRTITLSGLNQSWMLDDLKSTGHESYNGILIYPPSDSASYMAEIYGLFYYEQLLRNGDKSYWTEEHDVTLAMAGLYYAEVTHRNTKGASDWMAAIKLDVSELIKDSIEEEIEEIDKMEG